jgi:pimeloyl-ACP methyl ester carboxylesterase
MLLVLLLLVAPPVRTSAAGPLRQGTTIQEEVTFRNGDVVLAGTLIMPATGAPYPGVVIVYGSDPDARTPGILGYAREVFAEHGIAVLAYDKRGAGQSSGTLSTASLHDLAGDALAGVYYLKSRPDIDPWHLGMVGDSQAGWIIPLAAAGARDVAFMIVVAAAGTSPGEQGVYELESALRRAGLPGRVQDTGRKARKLANDYFEAVQTGQLPAPDAVMQIDGMGLGMAHDPVPVLEQITQPMLVIEGEADRHVPALHSAAVFAHALQEAGNRECKIIVYPGADHSIMVETTSAAGKKIRDYAAGYHANETNWVLAHAGKPAAPLQIPPQPPLVESAEFGAGGRYGPPPWYGTAAPQLALIGLFVLVFVPALVGLPMAAVARRRYHARWLQASDPWLARLARALAVLVSLLDLVALAGTVVFLADLLGADETFRLVPPFPVLPLLGLLITVLTAALCGFAVPAWRRGYWTAAGRVAYTNVAGVAVLFVGFLAYWNMVGLPF